MPVSSLFLMPSVQVGVPPPSLPPASGASMPPPSLVPPAPAEPPPPAVPAAPPLPAVEPPAPPLPAGPPPAPPRSFEPLSIRSPALSRASVEGRLSPQPAVTNDATNNEQTRYERIEPPRQKERARPQTI